MSKFKIHAVIVLVLTTVLAGAAYARGGGGGHDGGGGGHGGGHFGGGHGGGGHFGGASHFGGGPSRFGARPSFHGQRSFAVHGNRNRAASRAAPLNANRSATFSPARNATLGQNRSAAIRANAVQSALNSRSVAGALRTRTAVLNPNTRAQIVASAATAGWRGRGGWWQHPIGGYGWVGPLFWPFAYYDIYDYALWGYGYDPLFWGYGYNDIYVGLFAPYDYDYLLGYLPPGPRGPRVTVGQTSGARAEIPDQLAQMCGEDSRNIAGLPIEQIQQAILPNDAQRAALDDLANASVKAAQDIRAACPTQIALTAPGRLASMQQRIEAMIAAVGTVQPPLQNFYDLLNDEQKVRLNTLSQDQRRRKAGLNTSGSLAQSCGAAQPGVTDWPTAEIEARLHPTEAQRPSLAALQDASAKAAEMLKNSCPTAEPITPPARLEAIHNRLDTMLQAVKLVRAALDNFYATLSDEQKAQFEAIGPGRSALSNQPSAARRRHHARFGGLFRHFMAMGW